MKSGLGTQLNLFSAPDQGPVVASEESPSLDKPPKRPKIKVFQELIQKHLGPKTQIIWTDNKTTLLSKGSGKNKNQLRVHQMFMSGSEEIFDAIGRYFKTGHVPSGALIDTFIRSQEHLLMHHVASLPLNTGKGKYHNLHDIQQLLARIYFNNTFTLEVQWGRPEHRKRRRSIQLGSYDPRSKRITIHPSLDQSFVPEMCVARILHHEMCHHAFPAIKSSAGRRQVHHKAFKEAEAMFVGAMEADAWIEKNLNRLLRTRPQRHPKEL